MREIIFNSISSLSIPVYVSESNILNGAGRSFDSVQVPGKSGDLIVSNGRFNNVTVTYKFIHPRNISVNSTALKEWLYAKPDTYCRLEDSGDPGHYRMGQISGGAEFETFLMKMGHASIQFNCKPQRFLKSGEKVTTLTASGTITNPTSFDAKPLIRIYGTGTLQIGSKTVTVNTADEYTDLDCETEEAYKDDAGTNCNGNIEIADYDFPILVSGDNGITLGDGITKVEITPRWWTL